LSARDDVEQRFVFDEVAELYERTRPRYPDSFVGAVCRRSCLSPGARILEIGCGPAIATPGFAERGYAMVCLEPGPRMAELARRRLAGHADVSVVTTTFETWSAPPGADGRFDLVLAAQSFHWVDPAVGFSKAAAVLRPEGSIAIIANIPQPGESPVRATLDRVYASFGPAFAEHARASGVATRARLDELLDRAPEFGGVEVVRQIWTAQYDTAAYLALMETQSDHRMLPVETRRELLAAVAGAIDAHGGSIAVDYEARLLSARKVVA